jgi:hypothetical protein
MQSQHTFAKSKAVSIRVYCSNRDNELERSNAIATGAPKMPRRSSDKSPRAARERLKQSLSTDDLNLVNLTGGMLKRHCSSSMDRWSANLTSSDNSFMSDLTCRDFLESSWSSVDVDVKGISTPSKHVQAPKLSAAAYKNPTKTGIQPASKSTTRIHIPTPMPTRPASKIPGSRSGRSLSPSPSPYHSPVSVKKEELLVKKATRSLSVKKLDGRHLLDSPPSSPEDNDLTDRDLFASFKRGCLRRTKSSDGTEKLTASTAHVPRSKIQALKMSATTHNPTRRRRRNSPARRSGVPPNPEDYDLTDLDLFAKFRRGSLRKCNRKTQSADDVDTLNGSNSSLDLKDLDQKLLQPAASSSTHVHASRRKVQAARLLASTNTPTRIKIRPASQATTNIPVRRSLRPASKMPGGSSSFHKKKSGLAAQQDGELDDSSFSSSGASFADDTLDLDFSGLIDCC